MYTAILERMKNDAHIKEAIHQKKKATRKTLFLYSAVVVAFAFLLCFLASFDAWGWVVTWGIAAIVIALLVFFLYHKQNDPKIFVGKITRMEEDRKIVPQKGTGAFGRGHLRTAEVYELLVAITDESGATQVIFCPPQYEKVLKLGDKLLCHSLLPYPAHLSNPTKCICMHCGTMQAAENTACITCGASIYSLHLS